MQQKTTKHAIPILFIVGSVKVENGLETSFYRIFYTFATNVPYSFPLNNVFDWSNY